MYRGEIKGSETLMLILFEKINIDSPREQYTSFPLVTLECCCLPGKLQKQGKFVASFDYKIDEIPAIHFRLGRQARSQDSRMLAYCVFPL